MNVKGGSIEKAWGLLHKLRSWFGTSVCVPTVLNIPIHDTTGGYRLWRRQTLLGLDLDRIASNAYVFQVETAYMACRRPSISPRVRSAGSVPSMPGR